MSSGCRRSERRSSGEFWSRADSTVFVRMAFFPGGSEVHYAALERELAGVEPPAARLLFAAGPTADGWQVVQVWESEEELDRFNAQVFRPALERIGGGGFPSSPVVRDFHTTVWHAHSGTS